MFQSALVPALRYPLEPSSRAEPPGSVAVTTGGLVISPTERAKAMMRVIFVNTGYSCGPSQDPERQALTCTFPLAGGFLP
jgi:hypothetical protein